MSGKQRTRIYKNRWFAKFAIRAGISDATLVAAIDQAERGLIDAELGDGLIKQRVARQGEGNRAVTARWSSFVTRIGRCSHLASPKAAKPTST